MSEKRKSFTTRRGNRVFTVYDWTHPATGESRWRFAWRRNSTDPWKYKTVRTRAAAEEAIDQLTEEMDLGGLAWSELDDLERNFLSEVSSLVPESERSAVLSYLRSRRESADLSTAVERFMAFKIESTGENSSHLRQVAQVLRTMAKSLGQVSVADVSHADLDVWWRDRGKGLSAKRRKDLRAILVAFWRWARNNGMISSDVSSAERIPLVAVGHGDRRVLSPDELQSILKHVGSEWRSWVILGAFAGLRPEEISPGSSKRQNRRGIHWEEIDLKFGVIRLPACVSKTGFPRNIPINEACRAGLQWSGPLKTGPVCPSNPAKAGETKRLGTEVFKGSWPQDALRHSYGSYRNGELRSLEQVAEEMGTSRSMLQRHYHNPRTEKESAAWFAVRPEAVPICSDKTKSDLANSQSHSA